MFMFHSVTGQEFISDGTREEADFVPSAFGTLSSETASLREEIENIVSGM